MKRVLLGAALGSLAGFAVAAGSIHPAPAPAPVAWQEPYGGCKEAADYPGTPGWQECKDHGLLH